MGCQLNSSRESWQAVNTRNLVKWVVVRCRLHRRKKYSCYLVLTLDSAL